MGPKQGTLLSGKLFLAWGDEVSLEATQKVAGAGGTPITWEAEQSTNCQNILYLQLEVISHAQPKTNMLINQSYTERYGR